MLVMKLNEVTTPLLVDGSDLESKTFYYCENKKGNKFLILVLGDGFVYHALIIKSEAKVSFPVHKVCSLKHFRNYRKAPKGLTLTLEQS